MDINKEREAFENWAKNNGYHVSKNPVSGIYLSLVCNDAWEVWQAAKNQLVQGWISVEDSLPEFDVPVLAKNMNFERGKYWWVFERCDSYDGWVWSRFESSLDEAYCDDYEITHWMPLPESLTKECE